MKICLICVEIFAWGKYGGFGRSTRMLGRELVKRGNEVTAVIPRRTGQKPVEVLDGIRVLGFDRVNPFTAIDLLRQADAEIYHSQEPSFGTYLAQHALPGRKHVVTFRDTRSMHDWWLFFTHPTFNNLQVVMNFLYEDNALVHRAVRAADRCFTASHFLIPKARAKYRLDKDPEFLPSPIQFPATISKSQTPLVCFVGRLDRIKRPQIFFELARKFPNVDFVVVGAGHNTAWNHELLKQYDKLTNLILHGFIDQFNSNTLSDILGKSWILVNTSPHESLPTSFVEAAGHGCAILSEMDPDGFASDFGYHVQDGDYVKGLQSLLEGDLWREKAARGMQYARSTFALDESIGRHILIYQNL